MKFIKSLLFGLLLLSFAGMGAGRVWAEDKVVIELFYSATCSHCHEERAFLKDLVKKYPALTIKEYEVSQPLNHKIWLERGNELEVQVGPVPLTIIGERYWIGFESEKTTGKEMETVIKEKLNITVEEQTEPDTDKAGLFGNLDLSLLSLPILTVVVGLMDGFNPCAMWVLLFLISLLLGMKDRKRMWILGGVFIGTSGLVYFLVMTAWLNVFLLTSFSNLVSRLIGVFAVGAAGYSLRDWWINREGGCQTVGDEKRQRWFDRFREISHKKQLLAAAMGMVVLATAINMVELACSAGLPAVYTKVLSINQLTQWQYYLYILVYILFFMLDDLIVFGVAMVTLKAVGVESKYARWSRLIGGLVMLWIGLAMLFKPEWLAF